MHERASEQFGLLRYCLKIEECRMIARSRADDPDMGTEECIEEEEASVILADSV